MSRPRAARAMASMICDPYTAQEWVDLEHSKTGVRVVNRYPFPIEIVICRAPKKKKPNASNG